MSDDTTTRRDFVTHCVSTYPDDLAALDALVAAVRAQGYRRASRSSVIRAAVAAFRAEMYRGEVAR